MTFVWTTIQVSDLDRSLAFYHDLLGMPLCERFQGTGNEIAMLGDPQGHRSGALPRRLEDFGQGSQLHRLRCVCRARGRY